MSSSKQPKIGILGAGPAGLTLASLLTKNNIPYTIFDLRPRPSPSAINEPSGSLDLHSASGLLALKACSLYEKFQQLESDCGEHDKIADMTGAVQYQDSGNGMRPEVSRNSLTALLLSSIPASSIHWERKIRSVTHAAPKWKLHFESGAEEDFDLVIGADGAWSRIRPLLTSTTPHFSGINCITLTIPHLDTHYPHLVALVGPGTFAACGERKAVMAQRGSLESARLYLMISSPSSCAAPATWLRDSGLEKMSAAELKTQLLTSPDLFAAWGAELKDLVAAGCDAEAAAGAPVDTRPLHMLPPGHTWTHVPGLTLLGDAAHLMTPFAGEGVNTAMLDALELSQQIVQAYPSSKSQTEGTDVMEALDEAVRKYEEGMFPRAKQIMEETAGNMEMIFAEDSPRPFVEFMQTHVPPEIQEQSA